MSIYMAKPTMVDILRICHDARPEEIEQYEAVTGLVWECDDVVSALYNKVGVKFAFMDGNVPFSVGGWDPVIDGVWQSWMIGTVDNWAKYWRSITKLSRRTVDFMFSDPDTRRLQITALSSRTKACEWFVRGMKFQYESTMKCFGVGGEDISIYVKFRE